jgi:DNA-binding CsgD family transcriptional regulator
MKLDAIATIEAAYAPAATSQAWIEGVLASLAPLDRGHGLHAISLDANDPANFRAALLGAFRPDPLFLQATVDSTATATPDELRELFRPVPPVQILSRRVRSGPPPPFERAVLRVSPDVLGILALDADQRGVVIGIPWPTEESPAPRTKYLLSRIAAHLTSAWRLRALTVAGSEAVLDPSGAVRDAQPAAADRGDRALLGEAVRRMERARTRARRVDPTEAVELWHALVSGRWSLVDHVEADGRRFVLARRNEPHVYDPKALSRAEGQVTAFAIQGHSNKHIAYLLGIAPSTVAAHLASARRKLGVRTQSELVATFGGARA